jgi:hypothetical protein
MTKVAQIIELHKAGMRNGDIARKVGCAPAYVSQTLRGISASSYMREAADLRGLSLNSLRGRLLDVIARDKLVDAILDDGDA